MKTEQVGLAPAVLAAIVSLGIAGCMSAENTGSSSSPGSSSPSATSDSPKGAEPSATTAAPGAAGGVGSSAGAAGASGSASDPARPVLAPVTGLATSTATSTATTTNTVQSAAQLTAGTWDDNANFDFYSSYVSKTLSTQAPGFPIIDRADRMVILVETTDGEPVAGAKVQVSDGAGNVFTSTTGAEGRVLYFPHWNGVPAGAAVTMTASTANDATEQTATAVTGTVKLVLGQTARTEAAGLDLAFVIDTTGSMGDELSYVRSELDGIVGGIAAQFPALVQRFALVVYRDEGDAYVTRKFDFTADLNAFRRNLTAQSADGGGDTPEAVPEALAAAGQLSWQAGAVARMAFWIADAPHHAGRETAVVAALRTAVSKAVHIYPVAASGIDDLAEFTMRTAAEVTGGRYLFLTDDSGIGNSHAEPHIPCYYVTTLESAIRRMVSTEVAGAYMAPLASEIIRTSGNPEGQQCVLSGGTYRIW